MVKMIFYTVASCGALWEALHRIKDMDPVGVVGFGWLCGYLCRDLLIGSFEWRAKLRKEGKIQ